jgi:hypothetical protein
MRDFKAPVWTALAVFASACSSGNAALVTRPHWLYQMDTNKTAALAYDSRGRGAYLAPTNAAIMLCAEPPPDTSANLSDVSSSKVGIDAAATYNALAAKLGISSASDSTVTSQIADVAQRSELVLLMRDMLYRLCEMQFNKTIDAPTTEKMFRKVLQATVGLGERENVSKLVALIGMPEIDAPTKHQILVTILSLSLANQASMTDDDTLKGAQTVASVALLKGALALPDVADVAAPTCNNVLSPPLKDVPKNLCELAGKDGKAPATDTVVTAEKKDYHVVPKAGGFEVRTGKVKGAGTVAADCKCGG